MTYQMPYSTNTDRLQHYGFDTGYGCANSRSAWLLPPSTPDSRNSCKLSIATRQAGPFASVNSRQTYGLLDVKYLSGKQEQSKVETRKYVENGSHRTEGTATGYGAPEALPTQSPDSTPSLLSPSPDRFKWRMAFPCVQPSYFNTILLFSSSRTKEPLTRLPIVEDTTARSNFRYIAPLCKLHRLNVVIRPYCLSRPTPSITVALQ